VKKDRKWRLRCEDCGCPIGTWNSVKEKWSLWPTNFERHPETNLILLKDAEWLKPASHMFYNTRVVDIRDELPKWEGFAEESKRISDSG